MRIADLLDIEEVIDLLKEELITQGIPYIADAKRSGDNLMITCPYHSLGMENKPSMGVLLEENTHPKGTAHCFTCDTTVDLPSLISYVFGYEDFGMYGLRWLNKRFMIVNNDVRKPINILRVTDEKVKDITYIPKETYMPYTLNKHPYLLNRGIAQDVMEYFNIGFNPETQCVTFPIYDPQGRCIMIQERGVSYKFFKNSNDGDKASTLYGLSQLYEQIQMGQYSPVDLTRVFIVESPIDALYLWSYGYAALATMQAFPTKQQLELMRKLPIRNFVLAQDNDEAGHKGAATCRRSLKEKFCQRLKFPNGYKDINNFSPDEIQNEIITSFMF